MLDKNKIAKAARQISENVADAKGFDDSKPTHLAFIEGHVDGFNAGAELAINEFLKSLWHPASEEPDVRHKTIICLYKDGDICQDYDAYVEATESDKLGRDKFNWDYYVEDNKIKNWCYDTDLLPNEWTFS